MARPRTDAGPDLWRHPNGTWYVRHRGVGGGRVSTRTRDERAARAFLSQYLAGLEKPLPPAQMTVGACLDGYLKAKEGNVRSPDAIRYAVKALKAELGDLEPDHISAATLRRYAAARQAAGSPGKGRKAGRSAGTIAREVVTLRAALRWAHGERWIGAPPPLPMPVPQPPPRDRWLTREEAARLVAGAEAPHVRLFIVLGLATAARSGAILDLRWDQVDRDARRIDFGRGHGNKRRTTVPINDDLAAELEEAAELRCTDWVVEFNGSAPVSSIKTGFRRACERAKLEGITPHILRHTAATWMVMAGVPLAEVARMLGDSEKMVEKVYGKHAPDYLKRAAGALALGVSRPLNEKRRRA